MGSDQDLDPADAPSIPPTFKRATPAPADDATSITLPPPEPPTLVPTEPLQTLLPEAAPDEEQPTAPSPLARRARRPMSVKAALEAASGGPTDSGSPPAPARSAIEIAVGDAVTGLLPGAAVRQVLPVQDRRVFRALWQAHRVRAQSDGDHGLAVSASVLLDAAARLPEGALHAAAVDLDGARWAAWVDTATGTVLALAPPAYLAGL